MRIWTLKNSSKLNFSLNRHDGKVRIFVHFCSLIPFIWLLYSSYFATLGANPFATLVVITGHSAFILLSFTLAITPLRRWLVFLFRRYPEVRFGKRLSDWNPLIRIRKALGLYCFFYASLHAWVYLDLELSFIWEELIYEINTRPFIVLGLISWAILFILAVTSINSIQRVMKRWWRRTHRSIYIIPVLLIVHIELATKATDNSSLWYACVIIILLGHRLLAANIRSFKRKDDDGLESIRKS